MFVALNDKGESPHVFLFQPHTRNVLRDTWVFRSVRPPKAVGGIRVFGIVLTIWIFMLALFPPIAGAYVTLSGQCPMEQMMKEFRNRVTQP